MFNINKTFLNYLKIIWGLLKDYFIKFRDQTLDLSWSSWTVPGESYGTGQIALGPKRTVRSSQSPEPHHKILDKA